MPLKVVEFSRFAVTQSTYLLFRSFHETILSRLGAFLVGTSWNVFTGSQWDSHSAPCSPIFASFSSPAWALQRAFLEAFSSRLVRVQLRRGFQLSRSVLQSIPEMTPVSLEETFESVTASRILERSTFPFTSVDLVSVSDSFTVHRL